MLKDQATTIVIADSSLALVQLLARTFGASTARNLPYFEILIKASAISGAPHKVDVVAWRRLDL